MTPVASQQSTGHALDRYLEGSRGARSVFWFVLPLVLAAEAGLVFSLGPMGHELAAHTRLASVYNSFGIAGLHVPAAFVLITLITKMVIRPRSGAAESLGERARWSGAMVAESVVWAAPLIVLATLLASASTLAWFEPDPASPALAESAARGAGGVGGAGGVYAWPWHARVTVALGAGVYEEFLFRMVLMSLVHALAVDLAGVTPKTGLRLAIGVSAVLFALSHDLRIPGHGGGIAGVDPGLLVFLTLSGVMLGVLYVRRGFGIAVGVHAAYDLLALFPLGIASAE